LNWHIYCGRLKSGVRLFKIVLFLGWNAIFGPNGKLVFSNEMKMAGLKILVMEILGKCKHSHLLVWAKFLDFGSKNYQF
jgi:hypothetical protein